MLVSSSSSSSSYTSSSSCSCYCSCYSYSCSSSCYSSCYFYFCSSVGVSRFHKGSHLLACHSTICSSSSRLSLRSSLNLSFHCILSLPLAHLPCIWPQSPSLSFSCSPHVMLVSLVIHFCVKGGYHTGDAFSRHRHPLQERRMNDWFKGVRRLCVPDCQHVSLDTTH